MFLEITKLKKLMKEAYKGSGLLVGIDDGKLTVCGGLWGFSMEQIYVPNKLKGALAELIGDFPESGEAYRYTREEAKAEDDFFSKFDFIDQWRKAKEAATITPVTVERYENKYTLIQLDSSYRIVPVKSVLTDLISTKDMDYEHENDPGKPCTVSGSMFYWHNEIMVFVACAYSFDEKTEKSLITYLSHIDFSSKDYREVPFTGNDVDDILKAHEEIEIKANSRNNDLPFE